MWLPSWLRPPTTDSPRRPRPPVLRANRRPALEALEDRLAPATLFVNPGGARRAYASVQAAVDAARSGDTIRVAPGTYAEQVVINKDLTLIGSGTRAAVIHAPSTALTADDDGLLALVRIGAGANVRMTDFTVSGPGPDPVPGSSSHTLTQGIVVTEGATLDLSDTTVAEVRDDPLSGFLRSTAILVGVPVSGQTGHAILEGDTISGYQHQGILVVNPGSTAVIQDSTIAGAGATPVIAQEGVVVANDAAALIRRNVISGNTYTGPVAGPDFLTQVQAAGIAIQTSAPVVVANNVLVNNDMGLYGSDPSLTIWGNVFAANRFFGLVLDQGNATVTGNVISGSNVGVLAVAFTGNTANTEVTLIGNVITGNGLTPAGVPEGGLVVEDDTQFGGGPPAIVVTAHFNDISGNSIGVNNTTDNVVDARFNFWGSAAGPGGVGSDTVVGPVAFTPWLLRF
jgi:hypothetical protein